MANNQINNFIKKFNNGDGFYGYTPYIKETGFSIKKDLNDNDNNNTSLLKFYIPNDPKYSGKRKPIFISVTYGKKSDESVIVRHRAKISEPADLTSIDEYYYDVDGDKLYKGRREISPSKLVSRIYNDHVKPTKPIKGAWFRIKVAFWRIITKKFFNYVAVFLHYFLYIITGDKYSYEPIVKEETLNNEIISSAFKDMVGRKKKEEMKEHLEKGKKFSLFGYEASRWIILFYSMLHLSLYIIFEYKNWYPPIITTVLKNNFLTLIYVISSLWVMEMVIPTVLKVLIRITSTLSWNSFTKRIKI